jgi:hypothetical protein
MLRTARQIALLLIAAYTVALGAILGAAIYTANEIWFDLFKSGFLLLGGSLTTIIGYYFGSRGVQEAEQSAAIALREAEKSKKRADELAEKQIPTYDEVSLEEPTDEESEQ